MPRHQARPKYPGYLAIVGLVSALSGCGGSTTPSPNLDNAIAELRTALPHLLEQIFLIAPFVEVLER